MNAKEFEQKRVVRRVVLVVSGLILGYWMGYWHGRTYELYKSGQRYGAIPETMSWEEFLKRK